MINPSPFLRHMILADAVITGAMALLLATLAHALGPLLDLPDVLLREVGLFLLAYAALVGFIGARRRMHRLAVWAIVITNTVWTFDSIALLFTGWVQPNLLGQAFIVMQAVSVGVIAGLQFIGLRRSEILAAS